MQINYSDMVATLAKPGEDILASLTPLKCHLWHMASCIPGEAGELFDAVKKHVIYNKPMDRLNVIEELGDLEFYMEGLRQGLGITREETLAANVTKLGERYKGLKYSDAAAQERADKASDRSFIGQGVSTQVPMPPTVAELASGAVPMVPPSAPMGEAISAQPLGLNGALSHIHVTSLGGFVAYDEAAQELGRFTALAEAVAAVDSHKLALDNANDATTKGTLAFAEVATRVKMGSIAEVTYLLNAAENPYPEGTVGYNNYRAAFLAAGTAHIGG